MPNQAVIMCYSYTGKTRKVCEEISRSAKVPVEYIQEEKKRWAWMIKAAAASVKPGVPFEYADVTLRYSFKDKRRRDPDNYSGKMILDALVGAGIIKDDSFNNIKLILEAEFGKEKGTEIIVQRR